MNTDEQHPLRLRWAACLLLLAISVKAASLGSTNLSVTAYGANGDAQLLFPVNVVSNSPLVTCTGTNRFTSAAIGEVIELFGVHSQHNIGVTNEDIADLITNVVSGTNLYLSIVPTFTTNTVCTVGKNNGTNIQWCINDAAALVASGYSNVTIGIPDGNYIVIGTNGLSTTRAYATAAPGVTVQSGGITFLATNAVWVGLGAGVTHANGVNNYADRAVTVMVRMPTTNYDYPIIFDGLDFDGGVQSGVQAYQYFPPRTADGVGWDTTHHAVNFYDDGYPGQPGTQGLAQGPKLTVFTNCTFHGWRGEMVIGAGDTGGTNAFIDYANCGFYDGNASAINSDFAHHVHGCTFDNLNKVFEWYETRATLPSTWEFNSWSNIYNNECFTVVGAIQGQPQQPLTIASNICYASFGNVNLAFAPAENVSIVGNTLITSNGGFGISLDSAAVQPNNGTAAWNSNFFIGFNTFLGGGFNSSLSMLNFLFVSNHNFTASVTGGGYGAVDNAAIFKNGVIQDIFTNNVLMFNDGTNGGSIDCVAIGTNGQYWLDVSNNLSGWVWDNNWGGATNVLSYGFGRFHHFESGATFNAWYVDDTAGARIPTGALLQVTNTAGANIAIYLDSAMTRPFTLTNNAQASLEWNGTAWNQSQTAAPWHQNFRFLKIVQ